METPGRKKSKTMDSKRVMSSLEVILEVVVKVVKVKSNFMRGRR